MRGSKGVHLLHEVRELHDGLVVEGLDLRVHGQPHLLEQLGREGGRDAPATGCVRGV